LVSAPIPSVPIADVRTGLAAKDWYDYLNQLGKPAAPDSGGGNIIDTWGVVSIKDFGAVGDNFTDDTAAINAAYASLAGKAGVVIWPAGNYKVTDTIICGVPTGGNPAATSFISTFCPGGQAATTLWWHGPTTAAAIYDATAMLFAKNKYFICSGLGVRNATGIKGTTNAIMLGGSGSGASGTQTLGGTFRGLLIDGFNCGIRDGNFGAASEILFEQMEIDNCDTGWVANDFNTLNHMFTNLGLSSCGIGIDTGVSQGVFIYGGSSTQSQICDFRVRGNSQTGGVFGYRSEDGNAIAIGDVGACWEMHSVKSQSPVIANVITGSFDKLHIEACHFEAGINIAWGAHLLTVQSTRLYADTATNLPIKFNVPSGQYSGVSHALFQNNEDIANYPNMVPMQDFIGNLLPGQTNAGATLIYAPAIHVHREVQGAGGGLGRVYGHDWLALGNVRHLGEGAPPKALSAYDLTGTIGTPVFGTNLRVTGKFASSNTLNVLFSRPVSIRTGSGSGGQSPILNATVGQFFPTDNGKQIKIPGKGNQGMTDWYGWAIHYIDSTHVYISPATPQQTPDVLTAVASTVGIDEPDANYMIAGLCGDANETFWVTNIATTGFTLHSSNAASTATVVCLIVR